MNTEQPNTDGLEMKLPTEQPGRAATTNSLPANQKQLVIIVLIIALFALLVGLFLWYKASQVIPTPLPTPSRPTAEMNNEPESTTAEAQTESFGALSTSDEIEAIEADLESTNLDTLESELIQIETELEASM